MERRLKVENLESTVLIVLAWVLSGAVLVRIWIKQRRIDPLLRELRRCTKELRAALERGDLDAAERWSQRFEEIHELVKPMVDQRI
jgi:hypothetical protein